MSKSRLLEALKKDLDSKGQKTAEDYAIRVFKINPDLKNSEIISFEEGNTVRYFKNPGSTDSKVGVPHGVKFSVDRVENNMLKLIPVKKMSQRKGVGYKEVVESDCIYVSISHKIKNTISSAFKEEFFI